MTTATSFGAWIRQRRRTLDMTQEELAAHVGCSLSAIRKIEADDRRPSRQVANLLADTLVISQEERATFLRIARMELAIPHLATLAPAPTPTLASFSLPALNPAHSGNGANTTAGGAIFSGRSLPTPPTPLVGRADEVTRVAALLGDVQCRLLTLVGQGGVGKTRLAIAAANARQATYPDGVAYVGLAGVDAPDAIVDAVAGAVGFIFHGATAASTQLINFLRPKRILLLLDNLEHLLAGVDVLLEMLEQALGVKLLATSRESLGLPGEWVYEVHGLPVVDSTFSSREQAPTADVEQTAAAQLFLQAARRANPEFSAGADDLVAIERICQLVEGLPLGIELAAAWVRMLTCQEIANEIERSLDFLRTTARGVPSRQRSLRAAFDYSWALLEDDEQVLLRCLAVFCGGFTQPAAAAVANATLPALSTLLAKSLVHRDERGRYHLHETVRQYAVERLIDAGEEHSLQMRQFTYFLTLAQQADAARNRSDYLTLVDQLCAERDNLQSVLTWAFANDDVQVLQLVGLLESYLLQRPVRDAQMWLARSRDLADRQSGAISDSVLARLLWTSAVLAQDQDRSILFAQQALKVARRSGEERIAALAMSTLVNQGIFDGNYEQSESFYADALQIAQRLNDKVTLLQVYAARVELERYQGNYARAIELCSMSLALAQEAGRNDLANNLSVTLAKLALRQGDLPRAQSLLTAVLSQCVIPRDSYNCSLALLLLARAKIFQAEYDDATSLIAQSQAVDAALGFEFLTSFAKMLLGEIELMLGNLALARTYYEQSIELLKTYFEPMTAVLTQRGLACVALRQGDRTTAEAAIAASAQISQTTNERWNRGLLEYARGQLLWLDGDRAGLAHFQTGLEQLHKLGDLFGVAEGLEHVAQVLVADQQWEPAAFLLGAADALRTRLTAPVPPVDRARLAALTAEVQRGLGADFAVPWNSGAVTIHHDLPMVIDLALSTPV